ncbi:MAG TPA: CoA transferase [Xanthobacteraceae bacterium]|nr:CoA transferase [Xanthobacteraceae bacterium]
MQQVAKEPARVGPLTGVRVIDMTTVIMGPFATQIIADYGADVIKVEPPEGDIMRQAGPMRSPGMGAMSLHVNRNKRSIALDVKKEAGRRALLRLCASADVFVTNNRPASMRRLGLADEALRTVNPRLVRVSLIGYGEAGPYAGRPAYDDLIQGISGVAGLFARVSGQEPRYVPLTMADRIVGLNAVHVILAALIERDRVGEGQAVELAMFETLAQFVLGDHMGGRTFTPALGGPGYSRLMVADRRPYRTSDGYICVLVYTDKQWQAFFRASGRADLADDPRLKDYATRAQNYAAIYALLSDLIRMRPTAEWMRLLHEADIPCVPMNDLDSLIEDAHLQAAGFFVEMEHPSEGAIRLTGIPSRWSRSQPRVTRHPPRVGEHSIEILREAGYSDEEIAALCAEGAAVDGRNAAPAAVSTAAQSIPDL